jgi:hypothetical protein
MTDIEKQEVKSKAAKYDSEMSGKQYTHKIEGGNYLVNSVDSNPPNYIVQCSFDRLFGDKKTLVEPIDIFLTNYRVIE